MLGAAKIKEEFMAEAIVQEIEGSEADATVTHNFQQVYQELGLDSVVAGLELEVQNQDLGRLSKATQAKAASDLLAMRRVDRDSEDLPSPPAKRTRHVAETPVRERMDVAGGSSPGSSNTNSPSAAAAGKLAHSTPLGNVTPPLTPASKRRETAQNSAVASAASAATSHAAPTGRRTTARQAAKAAVLVPRTPDSDGDHVDTSPQTSAAAGMTERQARAGVGSSFVLSDKERKNQGLRQFSLRVCRQVEAKMTTTYNEVADELVKEFKDDDTVVCDEKNIRRRAYDALNVLTAMDIISKNRKDIQWKGFPHLVGEEGGGGKGGNREREKQRMQALIEEKKHKIREKKQQLEDLATHFVSLRQLLIRNERPEYKHAVTKHRINLPFVIVNTDRDNRIHFFIADDKKTARVTCTQPFELHDDREALKRMNLHLQESPPTSQLIKTHLLPYVRRRDDREGLEGGLGFGSAAGREFGGGDVGVCSEDDCGGDEVEQEEMDDD